MKKIRDIILAVMPSVLSMIGFGYGLLDNYEKATYYFAMALVVWKIDELPN